MARETRASSLAVLLVGKPPAWPGHPAELGELQAQGQLGCSGQMTAVAQPRQINFSEPLISFDFQQDGGSCTSFFPPRKAPRSAKND